MAGPSEDDYTCDICLDILCNPVELSHCGHTFCETCIQKLPADQRRCPKCRQEFAVTDVSAAKALRSAMMLQYLPCSYCSVMFRIDGLRCHGDICKIQKPPVVEPAPPSRAASGVGSVSHRMNRGNRVREQPRPRAPFESDLYPNRDTFTCPMCAQGPMDCLQLAEHVIATHQGQEQMQVVCPVCASMPWGSKEQVSSNFVQHMKIRHRFEYDRFVDFEMSEEEMLQRATEVSHGYQ